MKRRAAREPTPIPPTPIEPRSIAAVRPTRRTFLKVAGLTAGATAVQTRARPARASSFSKRREELAAEHADDPGLLIDLSKCIGCGLCVASCKAQNDLTYKTNEPFLGPDATLASSNWTAVRTAEEKGAIRYVKRQCMHCLEPACAGACFVKALHKSEQGPVVYDREKCVGCRYCLMACPFGVPTFEWEEQLPLMSKCNLCFDRVSAGEATACAAACPAKAIQFGKRGKLVEAAWKRINVNKKYQPHVYGETEAGGTSVMYVSDVPFERLGFATGLPDRPLPDYTWEVSRLIPPVAVGLAGVLAVLYQRVGEGIAREEAAASGEGGPVDSGGQEPTKGRSS